MKLAGITIAWAGPAPALGRYKQALTQALEKRWVSPAYSGWLLLALAMFFFAAATNTLAGWLYVISGVMLALLAIAANLSRRHLQGLVLERRPIQPTMAGETLVLAVRLHNSQASMKGPWQLINPVPTGLGTMLPVAVETLAPAQTRLLSYYLTPQQRGLYSWSCLSLRTAAPLGLCWSQRQWTAPATVLVYPQVLALRQCPWLERLGQSWGTAAANRRCFR
ncbi:MAG: hypothetical protein LVS60_07135 [Nodosilinea sp. LVE1205-7]